MKKVKTEGQQGDHLEMLIFNLTIHHLWGRVLVKYPQVRSLPYLDDGYISHLVKRHTNSLCNLPDVLRSVMSGLSTVLGKTTFRLIEIVQMYFETGLGGETLVRTEVDLGRPRFDPRRGRWKTWKTLPWVYK